MVGQDEARSLAHEAQLSRHLATTNIFRTLLHTPSVAKAFGDLLIALVRDVEFDARLRELIIMRVAWLTRCQYEWAQHWKIARELRISSDDLLAVRDWSSATTFGPTERAVLAATDETVAHGNITESTWKACQHALGSDRGLVELVTIIGTWRLASGLLCTLGIPLDDGLAGWPPSEPDTGQVMS